MKNRNNMFAKRLLPFIVAAVLPFSAANADEVADVNALFQARQYSTALTQADAFIAKQPRSHQMRFLKGLILTSMGRQNDAVSVFTSLTKDFPELPEPHNNLAVLFAANGQYDNARAALETAIRLKPDYARAYENLGEIYGRLAEEAYGAAATREPDNANLKVKHALVRKAFEGVDAAGAAPRAVPVALTGASSRAGQAAASHPDNNAVLATVAGWAKAWSARDVAGYLDFYGSEFRTPNGESRAAWEKTRQARIGNKEEISVSIEAPSVMIEGSRATVHFRQIYKAGKLVSKDRKTLELIKQGGTWKIVEERKS